MKKAKKIFKWILTVILGLQFILAGQAKFTRSDVWINQFDRWGYPDYFYLAIGGLELIGAILIFFPKYANKATIGLIIIMLGASITHLIYSENDRAITTLIISALLGVLFYINKTIRPQTQPNLQL